MNIKNNITFTQKKCKDYVVQGKLEGLNLHIMNHKSSIIHHSLVAGRWSLVAARCLLLAVLLWGGCTKEIPCPVPELGYDDSFTVDLLNPFYAPLKDFYTSVEVPLRGYKQHGVIVFHRYGNEFLAWDATCVNNGECIESGKVQPAADNVSQGKCARCQSRYSLVDGIHTDKRISLRAYYVRPLPNATEQYRVSNR
ncbi:hypothetical protein FACS1894156_7950 [Bacteroidia bacterium]|nr:hypothetical protein FACS1894156_7950 [Bacteroidia bacterium]